MQNEDKTMQIIDRFEQMEEVSDLVRRDEFMLGIDIDTMYKIDGKMWPAYKARQWIMRKMYYQLDEQPGNLENIEAIIRAAFRKIPVAAEEQYSIDEVVQYARDGKIHLGPENIPNKPVHVPWHSRFVRWMEGRS